MHGETELSANANIILIIININLSYMFYYFVRTELQSEVSAMFNKLLIPVAFGAFDYL